MKPVLKLALILALVAPSQLRAAPRVVADIPPVHSLVAMVMDGVGAPDLLLRQASDPHSHALRPSEARSLALADVLIWMGPALMPWMEDAMTTLGRGVDSLVLFDVPGTRHLDPTGQNGHRVHGGADDAQEHKEADHEEAGHDDHGHDDHGGEDHGHDDHGEEDHGQDDHDAHGHGADGEDPHAWLDPENARLWLGHIADTLARIDPAHGDQYRANAADAQARIDQVMADINAGLAAAPIGNLATIHDGAQYFAARFGLRVAATLSTTDHRPPSAAQMAHFAAATEEAEVVCVLVPDDQARKVARNLGIQSGIADPLGRAIEPGQGHYLALMASIAQEIQDCAKRP